MNNKSENPPIVLVVNDDQAALDLIIDLLEPQGYKIIPAMNAQQALEITAVIRADVVITDVVMPGMDGIELCRRLKADRETSETPVLLVSAIRKTDADLSEGFSAGADEYIEIPFRHEELLVKVARMAERHRVERRYRELVDDAPDIIYTRDMAGLITSINNAGVRFFGRPARELIGKHLGQLVGEDAAARELAEIGKLKTFEPVRLNYTLNNAMGEERYLEALVTLERNFQEPVSVRGLVRDVTDRERAESLLKRQDEEYRILFEANPCPMYVCDKDSLRFLAVNDAAVSHYGYSRDEFLVLTVGEIRLPDEVSGLVEFPTRSTGGQEKSGAWKNRKKDGSIIDVEVNWHEIDFGGRAAYLVAANDITEQKRAATSALENEERYRELFENANDIIYTHDLQGNFTSLNKTGERVTGYTRDEALTMNIADVLTPESMDTAKGMLARKAHERIATVYELEIFTKAHERVALEVSTRLIYEGGKPVGVQGIARDITSRKGAEDALKESEEKFRSIVETTNEWIWAIDRDGKHTYTNPAVEEILGYSSEEILGSTALSFLHDEDRGRFEKLLPLWIVQKQGWTGLVLRWKHKHGGYRYLESNGRPVFDPQGRLVGYRGADRDITERKLAEEALAKQAERAALTNRISQAVRRTLDVSEVFQTAVRELGIHLGVDRCSLFMKNEKAGRVVNVAEYHVPSVKPAGSDFDLPQVQRLNAAMERHGVLAFDDAAHDERIRDLYELILKPFDVKSIIYVGVSVGNELLGAFALSTTKVLRHWSDVDIQVAKAAADQTGIAIRQARLYQKAEATSMREALANKLSVAIRASLTLADVLDTATRELGQALSASRVQVRLYDARRGHESARTEYATEAAATINADIERLVTAHFARSTEPLVISDKGHFSAGAADIVKGIRAAGEEVLSQVHYPLAVNEHFRGVMSIYHSDLIDWDDDEILLVEAVASQLATGIAQAELFEMVARAKKEWEATFDAMSDGIFIFDPAGRLIRVNRAGALMDQSDPEAILGRQCCDILRASASDAACIVEQAFRRSRSINVEVMPTQLKRPILVTVEPVSDERGKTIAAVCTARDLSELRQVEAVARERQSLLQSILESARESIYALDSEGHYKWCNEAMLELTGCKLDEIIGHHFLERVHEEDREMRAAHFAESLNGEPQSFESRYLARDGSVRYVSVNTAPIVVDGQITGVLGIAHDITEQKQERERAARADKLRALGQLASGVAHDFNNSLAAILGRAQLILRRVEDAELIRSLGIIVTAAEDAAATVRRIQTFARKSLGSEFELLDMAGLVRDAIEITRTRWQNESRARGISINVTLKTQDGLMVRGNASELREVFVNLIVNAVDAMPDGGSLRICCKCAGDQLRLRFTDTGKGMTEEVRERIFEPFYTTKGMHGSGLGLAVSYGIVERHEGTISVESKVGEGTTFYIDFPISEAVEPAKATARVGSKTASLSVLVIDDEPFVRETLADMLADLDHKVVTAEGGRDALKKVTTDDFDLVFTDLAMPEMDGWETARAIRERHPHLPVVLVTGYGTTAEPPSGEHDLVAGVIGKPFDFDQVTGTIARVLNAPVELHL